MCREHSEDLARPVEEGRRLHGASICRQHDREGRAAGKDFAVRYVLDNDAFAAQQRGAAGRQTLVHGGEELQKRLLKATLRNDLERTVFQQLDIAHVRMGQFDGGIEHLVEESLDIPGLNELRARPAACVSPPQVRLIAAACFPPMPARTAGESAPS